MSRTFRNNPKSRFFGCSNSSFQIISEYLLGDDVYQVGHGVWENYIITRGGWRVAKSILDKEDYAFKRKLRGDCFTKYHRNTSVPHWFRWNLEKEYRHYCNREIHRFLRDEDYEVNVGDKPSGVDWYCW